MEIVDSTSTLTGFLSSKVVDGPNKVTEKKVEIATTEATKPNPAGPKAVDTSMVEIATAGINTNLPIRIILIVFSTI
jgi:pyrrolidone-carboxylate peptidase|tara:strand:- start:52 stop:282 length:231 start_codon:yes stop_codon:yes gene_type:complete